MFLLNRLWVNNSNFALWKIKPNSLTRVTTSTIFFSTSDSRKGNNGLYIKLYILGFSNLIFSTTSCQNANNQQYICLGVKCQDILDPLLTHCEPKLSKSQDILDPLLIKTKWNTFKLILANTPITKKKKKNLENPVLHLKAQNILKEKTHKKEEEEKIDKSFVRDRERVRNLVWKCRS